LFFIFIFSLLKINNQGFSFCLITSTSHSFTDGGGERSVPPTTTAFALFPNGGGVKQQSQEI
jgi:hypothetical protein